MNLSAASDIIYIETKCFINLGKYPSRCLWHAKGYDSRINILPETSIRTLKVVLITRVDCTINQGLLAPSNVMLKDEKMSTCYKSIAHCYKLS